MKSGSQFLFRILNKNSFRLPQNINFRNRSFSSLFSSYFFISFKCQMFEEEPNENHSVRLRFRISCLKLFHVHNFQFEFIVPVVFISTIFMISTKRGSEKNYYANTRKMLKIFLPHQLFHHFIILAAGSEASFNKKKKKKC